MSERALDFRYKSLYEKERLKNADLLIQAKMETFLTSVIIWTDLDGSSDQQVKGILAKCRDLITTFTELLDLLTVVLSTNQRGLDTSVKDWTAFLLGKGSLPDSPMECIRVREFRRFTNRQIIFDGQIEDHCLKLPTDQLRVCMRLLDKLLDAHSTLTISQNDADLSLESNIATQNPMPNLDVETLNVTSGDMVVGAFALKKMVGAMGGDVFIDPPTIIVLLRVDERPVEECQKLESQPQQSKPPILEPSLGGERANAQPVKPRVHPSPPQIFPPLFGQNAGPRVTPPFETNQPPLLPLSPKLPESETIKPNLNPNQNPSQNPNQSQAELDYELQDGSVRILLVEDDPQITAIFKRNWVNKFKQYVTAVDTGSKALDVFRSERFDIVFMDYQIPILAGPQVAIRMREYERETNRSRTPIIGVSGSNYNTFNAEEATRVGMDLFMPKPYDWARTKQIVAQFCPNSRKTTNG